MGDYSVAMTHILMQSRFKLPRAGLTLVSTILICVFYWVVSLPANATCLVPGGLAGKNIAYRYATDYIGSLLNADHALNRMSSASNILKRQTQDEATALANISEALKNIELAARGYECAARAIHRQEKFPLDRSNEFAQMQSELARDAANVAGITYLQLAKETRAIASLLVGSLKQSVSEVDVAVRMAAGSANMEDHMRSLFQLTLTVPNVLVDPNPDPSGRMSRLSITANEREDLVRIIDTGFGARARRQVSKDLPPIDAAVAMLRKWLTTAGHTPRP